MNILLAAALMMNPAPIEVGPEPVPIEQRLPRASASEKLVPGSRPKRRLSPFASSRNGTGRFSHVPRIKRAAQKLRNKRKCKR